MIYGRQKVNYDVDGIELLKGNKKEGEENLPLASTKILDDKDLKKIKILKMKKTLAKIDKNRFKEDEDVNSEKDEG